MSFIDELNERFSQARRALRTELDRSLQRSPGAWWIPSLAACVVWLWLANHERKQHA